VAKVTQRERFIQLRDIVEASLTSTDSVDSDAILRSELLGFIDTRIEVLDRKRSTSKGLTKEQLANEIVKKDMMIILEGPDGLNEDGVRAGDMAKALDISTQKATALLNQLVKDEYVIRKKTGKVTLFYAR